MSFLVTNSKKCLLSSRKRTGNYVLIKAKGVYFLGQSEDRYGTVILSIKNMLTVCFI